LLRKPGSESCHTQPEFGSTKSKIQSMHTSGRQQKWDRTRITGVDSCRIVCFSFGRGSGPGVKKFVKNHSRIRSHFSVSAVAGVCANVF